LPLSCRPNIGQRAVAALEAKQHAIDQINLLLQQERNNNAMLQAHLAEMARDHARIVAILVNARTILDEDEIQKMRRKRNSKSANAELPPVLGGVVDPPPPIPPAIAAGEVSNQA
jgi:2,3-bisphosphoglycerate-independent phosphoglycerate mutase